MYIYNCYPTLFHVNQNNWIPGFQELYSYDQNGNLAILLAQYWDGTEWINSFRAIHFWSPVIPVELSSFYVNINGTNVTLNWTTATETNNYGFEVERSEGIDVWKKLGFVTGFGTTTEVKLYSFNDYTVTTENMFIG